MDTTGKLPKLDSFVPTKADLSFCPLCLDKWTIFEEPGPEGKVFFTCVKPKCMISIWVRDPMLGRWVKTQSEKCAVCGNMMRLFFDSSGYIKMVCPKCGCSIENVDNDKHAALMKAEEDAGKRKTINGTQPSSPKT